MQVQSEPQAKVTQLRSSTKQHAEYSAPQPPSTGNDVTGSCQRQPPEVQQVHSVSLPAVAAILFYWIRMKVVQQLTCLTLGRPNGPAYSTGEHICGTYIVIVHWKMTHARYRRCM